MMRKQHGPVARSFRDGFRQVLASRQPTRKVYMRSLKNTFKLPLALALAAGFAAPAMAQEPEQGPALKRNVNLVNLFATVRDKNKRIIGDMKDRKSTRLNSSHQIISYAVFCLKKKNKEQD